MGGGETDESTCLIFIPVDVIARGSGPIKLAVDGSHQDSQSAKASRPDRYEDIKHIIVPSGAFALEYLRRQNLTINKH